MKRFVTALVLMVASLAAFASPSPKQIESALASRDYVSARSMVSQVLAERPDSARAHLMNAYILAAGDHNRGGAQAELQVVRTLDKKGDVVGSALYGRTVSEIDHIRSETTAPVTRPAPVATTATTMAPASPVASPATNSGGHGFLWFLVIVAVIALGVWLWRRNSQSKSKYEALPSPDDIVMPPSDPLATTTSMQGHVPPRPIPAPAPVRAYTPAPAPAYYEPTPVYQPSYAPAPVMSNGTAMAAGALAGVAGAVLVENAIENAHMRNRIDDLERDRRRQRDDSYNTSTPAPAPYYAPAPAPQVDADTERDSFSSSTTRDNSWSNDDSRSSSSSSSSGSDSWGGSDSGSSGGDSGGGSDW